VDLAGDADLGGAKMPAQVASMLNPMDPKAEMVVVDLVEELSVKTISKRPLGKGPVEPEALDVDGGATRSWGETPMIWPNLYNPEAGAKFILDDPAEANL